MGLNNYKSGKNLNYQEGTMTETKAGKREKLGILCCVAGAMSWGLSGTCSEALFSQYPVDTSWVTAVRMTAAGILLLILAFSKQSLDLKILIKEKKVLWEILLFALAGLALCQYAYLSAIKWTNSGTATVIQNLSIVFIAGYVCLSTRTAPDKRTVLCIILALIGVWLLATGGKPGNMKLTSKGLLWGLMAGIGAASYSLLSRKPVKRLGSIPVTGLGMFTGGIALSLITRAWNIPAVLDGRAILYIAVIVLLGTVGAFTLFLQGISMVGSVKAALLACLEPLTAAALSVIWLHSSFTPADLIGFACILATVVLMR